MLARTNRFHGHQSVRRIYRQGSAVRGGLMSLHVYQDERNPKTKAAVVVSRKVDKSAVTRNRIRRRVYEQVRLQQADFKKPAEMIFTVYKPELATIPAEDLAREVKDLLTRAHLL